MSSNEVGISARVREVIEAKTAEKGRVKELEALTGIAASSWKNFLNGQQKATIAMAEKVSQAFPEMAFWIATGISDDQYGHVTPKWSSKHYAGSRKTKASSTYFEEALKPQPEELENVQTALQALDGLGLLKVGQGDPMPASERSSLLKAFRWMHIFLDEYILNLGIETSISAFNEMRSEAQRMKGSAIDLNETDAYEALQAHFAEKKAEIEKLAGRLNRELEERMKQINITKDNGDHKK